jgi:hypothetical protein
MPCTEEDPSTEDQNTGFWNIIPSPVLPIPSFRRVTFAEKDRGELPDAFETAWIRPTHLGGTKLCNPRASVSPKKEVDEQGVAESNQHQFTSLIRRTKIVHLVSHTGEFRTTICLYAETFGEET